MEKIAVKNTTETKEEPLTLADIEQQLNEVAKRKESANSKLELLNNQLAEVTKRKEFLLKKIKEIDDEREKLSLKKEEKIIENEIEANGPTMIIGQDGSISDVELSKVTTPEVKILDTVPVSIEQQLENLRNKIYSDVDKIKLPSEMEQPVAEQEVAKPTMEYKPWPTDKGGIRKISTNPEEDTFPIDPSAPVVQKQAEEKKKGFEIFKKIKNMFTLDKSKGPLLKRIKSWILDNKAPAALFATTAVAVGSFTHQQISEQKHRLQENANERMSFEPIHKWLENKSMDTTKLYNKLGGQAKMRLASMVLEDYQIEQRSKNTTPLSRAEIEQREKDPHIVDGKTLFSMPIAKVMSGGDYSKPVQENTAVGAYAINMRYWADKIGGVSDGIATLKYIHENPYLQDQYIDIVYDTLHAKYGDDMQKIFAGFLKPDTGPEDVGTPAGDVVFDESGMTVNKFVKKAMAEYENLKNATSNGGRFIVDAENQKMYFVDMNYQPTYETDIYKVEKDTKLASFARVIDNGPQTYYKAEKVQGFLQSLSRTVDYTHFLGANLNNTKTPAPANVFFKKDNKLVSSKEKNPAKVFDRYNAKRAVFLENNPGADYPLNVKKEVKTVKKSRITKKNGVNS
jgi:hypothetical protein